MARFEGRPFDPWSHVLRDLNASAVCRPTTSGSPLWSTPAAAAGGAGAGIAARPAAAAGKRDVEAASTTELQAVHQQQQPLAREQGQQQQQALEGEQGQGRLAARKPGIDEAEDQKLVPDPKSQGQPLPLAQQQQQEAQMQQAKQQQQEAQVQQAKQQQQQEAQIQQAKQQQQEEAQIQQAKQQQQQGLEPVHPEPTRAAQRGNSGPPQPMPANSKPLVRAKQSSLVTALLPMC